VSYADGSLEQYHVPLGIRELSRAILGMDRVGPIIGEFTRDGRQLAVFDALADPQCAAALWRVIAASETHPTALGEVRCRSDGIVIGADDADVIRPLGAEQSNTSLVRGVMDLFKCVRRIELAQSPEIEMTEALTRAGFPNVAAPVGVMEYRRTGCDSALLGMVQPYLRNGVEGWALALTSLRDLYDEAELEGVDADPAQRIRAAVERGASFIPEAERLGTMTGRLHLALAMAQDATAMAPEPVDAPMLHGWAAAMTAEFDQLVADDEPRLDRLRKRRTPVVACFDALRSVCEGGLAIRVHGDYHLGQIMRTDDGWTIFDFEGEPARPPSERRFRSSPLRDVAGMMRSLDYAAAAALRERLGPGDAAWAAMSEQGDAWAQANRSAFWEAYLAVTGDSAVLPHGADLLIMRRAFELTKAVYEVRYELYNRPDWLEIPLSFLLREAS
jgi:maltokinase